MTHVEFLEKFGPAKGAAEAFGVSVTCIGHWKTRGIPPFLWPQALEISQKNGWPLTAADLMTTSPSKRVQRNQVKVTVEDGEY